MPLNPGLGREVYNWLSQTAPAHLCLQIFSGGRGERGWSEGNSQAMFAPMKAGSAPFQRSHGTGLLPTLPADSAGLFVNAKNLICVDCSPDGGKEQGR